MYIPLNQLYNFLDGHVDNNTLIYRFLPHGSKNIEDLTLLKINTQNWQENLQSVIMIMHDQEPLNFDFYDPSYLSSKLQNWFSMHRPGSVKFLDCSEWVTELCHSNLALITNAKTLYDKNLICHSELRSSEVVKYQSIGLEPVYWWSHALIARNWYRYAKYDTRLNHHKTAFELDFNIYNRAWTGTREYRLKFVDLLINQDLCKHSNVKFNAVDSSLHYTDHKFKNINFQFSNALDQLPENTADSSFSAEYSTDDYNQCWFDVVLETLFDDQRLHLTEKILRPIACGKPFILAGTQGSLKYLHSYGFKTFDGIINEDYDSEPDPIKRLSMIVDEMRIISNMHPSEKQQLHIKMQCILDHNRTRFFSDDFAKHIIIEFYNNYRSARNKCNQHKKGQNYIHWRKMINQYPKLKSHLLSDPPIFTRRDVTELLLSISVQ